jgi:hypothetical protein
LIIHQNNTVNPIEIKKGAAPKGAVVCLASNVLPIDKKNWYVPAWLI